ncbi:MAG: catalase [Methylibium sp.]|nr:catalase [Methylibium sp.]
MPTVRPLKLGYHGNVNRGPALLEDQLLREKTTAFDHERIPERVVPARSAAAHGFFAGRATVKPRAPTVRFRARVVSFAVG